MRTNAGRITLIQIKLKRWHDCSPPNVVVWITDRSYCRTSPGSSGVQLECLMKPKLIGCIRFLCIARKKKKKKTTRLPSCGWANEVKESSCGLSLAKNKDRQKIEKQRGFTTKTWEKNMHFDVDLHSGGRARADSPWRPIPARLTFLCHTCETPASYQMTPANNPPSAWNSKAWQHHPEAAIAE